MSGDGRPLARPATWAGAALVLGVMFLVWRSLQLASPPAEPAEHERLRGDLGPADARPAGPSPVTSTLRALDGAPEAPSLPAPSAAPGAEPSGVPHPITPQHAAIFEENALREGLAGAVARRDFSAAQRLLREHATVNPGDPLKVRAGYTVLLDCLARPGDDTRAAARRFYDTETASSLRRQIRRECLEALP